MARQVKNQIIYSLKLIGFTLLSILIRGYQYGSGNQVHYFNFAFHKFYPDLFSKDYLFKIHDLPYTIFVDAINWMLKVFGESNFAFFSIYFLLLLAFYYLIHAISDYLFKNKFVSWVILLFFIFPLPIGGSTINTLEKSLMPRFVAEVFLLGGIYLLLKRKFASSAFVAGLGFLIHPLTLIPYLPIAYLSELFTKPTRSYKSLGVLTAIFAIMSWPILSKFLTQGSSGGLIVDPVWLEIIHNRLPYLFIQEWSIINFVAIAGICTSFAFYMFVHKKKLPSVVNATLVVSINIFGVALLSSILGIRLGLQLQLARNLYPLIILAMIYVLGTIFSSLSKKTLVGVATVALLATIVLCFPVRKDYGILWLNPLDDYQKAALWAKNNSSENSLFVVPYDEYGFRFWSKRAVFLEQKEGGDSLYDRNFALEWSKREQLLKNNPDFEKEFVDLLKNNYQADYVVTKNEIPNLELVYQNPKYWIYKL